MTTEVVNDDGASVASATSSSLFPSGSAASSGAPNPSRKSEHQMAKLKDANSKYKNLLKMAKERIQTQEDELGKLRDELSAEKKKAQLPSHQTNQTSGSGGAGAGAGGAGVDAIFTSLEYDIPNTTGIDTAESTCSIVRVCRCIKVETDDNDSEYDGPKLSSINGNSTLGSVSNNSIASLSQPHQQQQQQQPLDMNTNDEEINQDGTLIEIWALIEYEAMSTESSTPDTMFSGPAKRFKRWRRFHSESALSDHIRRDTGEPITIPPYSLSPYQSERIEEEARQAVTHITEEFRRFRVRAEVARKQADATVRALQNSNVETAQRRIEGQDLASELAQARTDHAQLNSLKSEMAEQEAHWKQAYDTLLAENVALRSSGSEALLAAQWRQRYEACLREKEDLQTNLVMEREKLENIIDQKKNEDAGKYELKYKDLKESFRLYRKKAKEIFEAQQRGDVAMLNLSSNGTEDAKITYLRNLMVNYLSSDAPVREHMEGAIGTVLKFSHEDIAKITKQKTTSNEAWF